ncbi:putative amidoligase enzyme-domain-containing protein [Xylariaceae sp. FL1651]|nr:putative amidoligase enzyme-domain-containing protein [Xylariaceae sp. FL1651]
MADYHFGIEIEVLVKPHKIRNPLIEKHALYYEKLAAALRNRGLKSQADSLQNGYSKHPEHYDKWWITKDSSLGNPEHLIPMEAVSPVLGCRAHWEGEIDKFWAAMRAVFHMPERSPKCGSHIHISRGQSQRFTLPQLKTIAYGIVIYEPLVLQLLMVDRAENTYCMPNTQRSTRLRQCGTNWAAIAQLINSATSNEMLRDIMQDNRYVLWNFDHILPGRSGTIEFRGGRCLRGEIRTKRWIAFTVAITHAFLSMNDITHPSRSSIESWSPKALYEKTKKHAEHLSMRALLPDDYEILNESIRYSSHPRNVPMKLTRAKRVTGECLLS